MDLAADAYAEHAIELSTLASLSAVSCPYRTARSPPRRRRSTPWRMWLSSRVGAAEAALATVFVGGTALAASPSRARRPNEQEAELANGDDEAIPPIDQPDNPSSIDISLADAWGAVRRAAAAAMMAFEDPPAAAQDAEIPQDTGRESSSHVHVEQKIANLHLCDEFIPEPGAHHTDQDVEYSDVTASSSMGEPSSWRDSDVSSSAFDNAANDGVPALDHDVALHVDKTFALRQYRKSVEDTSTATREELSKELTVLRESGEPNTSIDPVPETNKPRTEYPVKLDPVIEARLVQLRVRFDVMFEQNGGAECVSRVKQIGDDALIGMRDTADLDERVMAELDDAKLILDDALRRLDAAVRSKVSVKNPEYADAANAAESVIDETKENVGSSSEKAKVLSMDGSRLLAVFATKVCASALRCLENDKDCATWSERVERMAEIATVGVSQLRTISYKFAAAIARVQGAARGKTEEFDAKSSWPVEVYKLNETAIGHVLQCIALAIAALQIEAAERAFQFSTQI